MMMHILKTMSVLEREISLFIVFDIPAPITPPSEQLVTVSGGGGLGYKHR